jgi:DCN1-like protein 1/2
MIHAARNNALFPCHTERDSDIIAVDGTIRLCQDLGVNPEDVVMLAVAFELGSPRIGEWDRRGWTNGWKRLGFVPPCSPFASCP